MDVLLDEDLRVHLVDITADPHLTMDEPLPLLAPTRGLHEPTVGAFVRNEYCVCAERAGPHRHGRSLVDSHVKAAVCRAGDSPLLRFIIVLIVLTIISTPTPP
jgi:hypothetical protein